MNNLGLWVHPESGCAFIEKLDFKNPDGHCELVCEIHGPVRTQEDCDKLLTYYKVPLNYTYSPPVE